LKCDALFWKKIKIDFLYSTEYFSLSSSCFTQFQWLKFWAQIFAMVHKKCKPI
jgi:hypothetical protein